MSVLVLRGKSDELSIIECPILLKILAREMFTLPWKVVSNYQSELLHTSIHDIAMQYVDFSQENHCVVTATATAPLLALAVLTSQSSRYFVIISNPTDVIRVVFPYALRIYHTYDTYSDDSGNVIRKTSPALLNAVQYTKRAWTHSLSPEYEQQHRHYTRTQSPVCNKLEARSAEKHRTALAQRLFIQKSQHHCR